MHACIQRVNVLMNKGLELHTASASKGRVAWDALVDVTRHGGAHIRVVHADAHNVVYTMARHRGPAGLKVRQHHVPCTAVTLPSIPCTPPVCTAGITAVLDADLEEARAMFETK